MTDFITYSFVKRGNGYGHANFCEDFSFISQQDEFLVCGVFDGCSTGVDSHFASALFAKAFRSAARSFFQKEEKTDKLKNELEAICFEASTKIYDTGKELDLPDSEMLSTAIVLLANKETQRARAVAIGDGMLWLNGEKIEIDQQNQPDYLVYHLFGIRQRENFRDWFEKVPRHFEIETIEDISISTDGVLSFLQENHQPPEGDFLPENFLLGDDFLVGNKAMFARKCNILKTKHKLDHYDDLGIIRVIRKK